MSDVERQGCDARYLGPSLLAILAAETAPLLRVHILEIRGAIDLQHAAPDPDRLDAVGDVARHQAPDMLVCIVWLCHPMLDCLDPFFRHRRARGGNWIESHRACTADQITTAVINNNCPSPLMTAASTSEGCRSFA
jgi:hypothetical protein